MRIDYEKRKHFSEDELDLISKSSDSRMVKSIINRYYEAKDNHVLTFITLSLIVIISLIIIHQTIIHDQHTLMFVWIGIAVYMLFELVMLLFNKYVIVSRMFHQLYLRLFPSYSIKSVHRRLANYYPIKISDDAYAMLNGYYMQGTQMIEGTHFIRVKNDVIYFNPVSDYYVRYNEPHYCEIISDLYYKLVNQHFKIKQ